MSKSSLFPIFTFTFIILLVLTALFLPLILDFPKDKVIEEFNSDTSIFSIDNKSKINGGFDAVVQDTEYSITRTKFDLFNPQYAFILKSNVSNSTTTWLIKIKREGVVSWSIEKYQLIRIDSDITETQSILKKNNLFETNPDPENIFIVPQR